MLCVLLFLIIVNADLYTLVVSQTSLKLYPLRKIKQTGLHGLMEGQSFCIMSVGLGSTHKPIFFSRKQLQFHAGIQTNGRKRANFCAREHGLATFCLKH